MEKVWQSIIRSLTENPRDVQTTVKSDKKIPLWFHTSVISGKNGDVLIIENAKLNSPSVSLSQKRRIYEKDFYVVYPFYLRRENGESVSSELAQTKGEAKKNQTYIYGIVRNCTVK